jgi:hypothetical protein
VEKLKAVLVSRIASRALLATLVIFLFTTLPVVACSNGLEVTDMKNNFLVEVRDGGKPVAGLKVELRTYVSIAPDDGKPVTEITTDRHGRARFTAVPAAMYYVAVKHPAASPAVAIRIGQAGPKTANKIALEWPGMKFAPARAASGTLQGITSTDRGFVKDLAEPIYKPLVGSKVTLSKAISNEQIAQTVTGAEGKFEFSEAPAGSYFLHVDPPPKGSVRYMQAEGYVPIAVTPASPVSNFNLALTMNECGGAAYVELGPNSANHAQTH